MSTTCTDADVASPERGHSVRPLLRHATSAARLSHKNVRGFRTWSRKLPSEQRALSAARSGVRSVALVLAAKTGVTQPGRWKQWCEQPGGRAGTGRIDRPRSQVLAIRGCSHRQLLQSQNASCRARKSLGWVWYRPTRDAFAPDSSEVVSQCHLICSSVWRLPSP